jgi:S1-C subfamily serine protease
MPISVSVEIGERPSEVEEYAEVSEGVWRGIEVKDITPEAAKRYNITQEQGVIVTNVEIGSLADEAGVIIGDLIDMINKEPIANLKDYNRITASAKGDALVRTNRGYTVIKEKAKEKPEEKSK